ncbi:MAG: tetratricopeptide repeat protein [Hormoscilla sp. GUM202]|nr:tetratricopeptide repeat protein [Hormoscilla sp. GUM202]
MLSLYLTLLKNAIYYQRCGNLAEAARQYEQAIALKPNCLEAICNLGIILKKQGKIAEALGQYRQALAIKPDYPEVYYRMGLAWQEQRKFAEAIACYQKAIALKPDLADAYIDLGIALQEQLKLQEAMSYYRHAIALKPDAAKAHMGSAWCLLLLQDFQQGFAEYEWRWRTKSQTPEERLGKPPWDGSPLAGKTILLHTEQGHGDGIQFVRYAPLVAQRGAGKVILETYRSLRRLLTTAPGVQEVVLRGEPLPAFDLQVPLMSLPHILNTAIETIPARIPYLYAEEKDTVKYSELLRTEGEVKVGIVWAANAKSHAASKRSCPVSLFLELSQIPGISLYSLQKEHTDILDGAPIQDLRELLHDFADTAAVISQLDLVISVDTAVAHLAGALGKPVWVLLPFSPDWRWLLDRSDSPWYPTMRLFRQAKPGDWQSVFAQVKAALTVPGEL